MWLSHRHHDVAVTGERKKKTNVTYVNFYASPCTFRRSWTWTQDSVLAVVQHLCLSVLNSALAGSGHIMPSIYPPGGWNYVEYFVADWHSTLILWPVELPTTSYVMASGLDGFKNGIGSISGGKVHHSYKPYGYVQSPYFRRRLSQIPGVREAPGCRSLVSSLRHLVGHCEIQAVELDGPLAWTNGALLMRSGNIWHTLQELGGHGWALQQPHTEQHTKT